MNKKICFILLVFFLFFFVGCIKAKNEYQELTVDSPKIVDFNYRIYEKPPVGEIYHFPFTIMIDNWSYMGDRGYIEFESGDNYDISENGIEFTFDDRMVNLWIRMNIKHLQQPMDIKFNGYINHSNQIKKFRGALRINREQPTSGK
jgi:hypothetical protein